MQQTQPPIQYSPCSPPIGTEPDRIVTTQEAAAFCGFSVSHWRALWYSGRAPRPIKLSERKNGWRLSDLRAWIDSKSTAAA